MRYKVVISFNPETGILYEEFVTADGYDVYDGVISFYNEHRQPVDFEPFVDITRGNTILVGERHTRGLVTQRPVASFNTWVLVNEVTDYSPDQNGDDVNDI